MALTDQAWADAAGNPLAILQRVEMLAGRGAPARRTAHDAGGPVTNAADGTAASGPRGAVEARLDLLGDEARTVLRLAAVCGPDFDTATVTAALPATISP